MIVDGGCNLSL